MKSIRSTALLSLVLALGACEGGSRGSGITTVQGNVESVEAAFRDSPRRRSEFAWLTRLLAAEGTADADGALEGIRVSVEGSSIADDTDVNGFFSLRGHFEGDVAIRFERPIDEASARMAVNVPAAGMLTLNNVTIDGRNGEATAESADVAFDGLVASADCSAETLGLVSSEGSSTETDVYVVDLDTSSLHDAKGTPVACEELTVGEAARLAGSVNADGTFGNADIEVEP
ncbi:MAG TPA: hypothetical protein VLF14_00140 [Candidatus Binatia bacterium]|nr:hypothetical protein [Candidatus Binatia bacterium]